MLINKDDFDPAVHRLYEPKRKREGLPHLSLQRVPDPVLSAVEAESDPRSLRQQELEKGYEEFGPDFVKAIAETYFIVKPNRGWKYAIPLILKKEFPDGSEF